MKIIFIIIFLLTLSTTVFSAYMGPARNFGIAIRQAGHGAATVTFGWEDPNDESVQVEGYYFYCRGQENIKGQITETTYTVEMRPGVYECWATAYKGEDESGPSNIVTVKVK